MYIDITFPPGLRFGGTKRQSMGRWRDANLVRFYEGDIRPIGGWYRFSTTALTGAGREIISWSANDNSVYAAIGTHSNLFIMTKGGTLQDITPAGFVAGTERASQGGGYGSGAYGQGAFGAPIQSDSSVIPASVWSLDTWGENLVGAMGPSGTIYEWVPDVAFNAAQPVANAPTANAILVSPEDILVAIGAADDPRLLQWSDVRNNTVWTPTATNRAGDIRVPTQGKLLCGARLRRGFLVFSDTDVWIASYLGTAGYGIQSVSDGTGAISQNAVVRVDDRVFWMGREGFWLFAGQAFPLECDVADKVFPEINRSQLSLVSSFHNSAFSEVWWFYPDNSSDENNRYVVYNYKENHWSFGAMNRLAAVDRSPFDSPLKVGSDGYVYAHEASFTRDGVQPYLVGGPLTLGKTVADVMAYIPDGNTVGDGALTLTSRYYPHGPEVVTSNITAADKTDVRMNGREVDIRFDMLADQDWRVGVPQLEIVARGGR